MPGFKGLGVSEVLSDLLKGQGIVKPTPVQEEAIPPLVQGLDVIARAKTGTGKTLAFLLPIMDKIRVEAAYPQALILAPTRELALQITEEARKLARHTGVKILAVYGGQDVEKQLRKLEGGRHLIIGTPGRLLDHLRRETLDLGGVKMLVLDEADQMLHMGFLEDVETIITSVPYRRQTMLFSATMPDAIKRLAANYMKEPLDIIIKSGSSIPLENIRQQVVECSDRNKEEALQALIERDRPYLAIIFCRTKRRVSKLNEALQAAGYDCDELHGDLSQAKREAVMKRFRDAKLQLLVATDVAARGLDVEGVTHVFNYDLPLDADSYIHRIGRTGRAGGKGLAITFASPREYNLLDLIEHGTSQRLDRRRYEKDEFGVGEFTSVQGGPARGRRSGAPEPARAGRGGRNQGRSGGAPRAEGGARQGGRARGKEAGGWDAPAEGRGRSEASAGKRSAYDAAARRGGDSAGRSAAKPRPGGGYGSFDARSNAAAADSAAGANAAGKRGGRGAAGSKGGPSSGYSTNVTRGEEAGGFSYGASKGAGSGAGYNPGGAKASPKHRANVARSNEAGAWSVSPPAKGGGSRGGNNAGGSRSGNSNGAKGGKGSYGSYSQGSAKGGKGGYSAGGRSSGGAARGGRGSGSGGSRGGRGSSR